MELDRKYLMWALGYLVVGLALGIYMSVSSDHAQGGTHTHMLLLGSVVSFIYGVIHKLWLGGASSSLAKLQFLLHQAGTVIMLAVLFLLLGKIIPGPQAGPVIAIASIAVFAAALLMLNMVLKSGGAKT
jgi:hypothetical protein